MSNVRCQKVIIVGSKKYITVQPAVEEIVFHMSDRLNMKLADAWRDAYRLTGENAAEWRVMMDALKRIDKKATRRITPIIERALK